MADLITASTLQKLIGYRYRVQLISFLFFPPENGFGDQDPGRRSNKEGEERQGDWFGGTHRRHLQPHAGACDPGHHSLEPDAPYFRWRK